MNRDPGNYECTRDPIFILQIGVRQWTEIPDGLETDGESFWVSDPESLPDWIHPFVEDGSIEAKPDFWAAAESETNDSNWPICYTEWHPERVFLTREEAEEYARSREYRWDKWKVFCIPCEGKLAEALDSWHPSILNEAENEKALLRMEEVFEAEPGTKEWDESMILTNRIMEFEKVYLD